MKTWSVSGGTEKMKYYFSLGSKYEDAYYKHSATNFTQYDFRSNIDGKITENISLSFDIAGRQEDRNFPTVSRGDIFPYAHEGETHHAACGQTEIRDRILNTV